MMHDRVDFSGVVPEAPKGLYVALNPYPHLRDEDGCVLAADYTQLEKLAFILAALTGEA